MKIPIYDEQVNLNPAAPRTQNLPAPLASAFPSPVHEANVRLGQTLSNVGEKLAAHAIEFQKEQNETQLFKLDNDFGNKITDKLDNEKDGLLSTRKLGNAKGATSDFNTFQEATLKDIDALEVPDAIKRPLRERAITRMNTAKSAVNSHEARELDSDHKISFNANIANQTRTMSYAPTAKDFLAGRAMLHATIEGEANRLQVGPEVKAKMFAAADEDALKAYVGANLESNPQAALAALSKFKGSVDKDAYAKIESEANKNLFASTVLSSKMAGMGKDQILAKYVAGEKDPSKQADMATMVNRAFATDNYATINALRDGVDKDTVTPDMIDGQFNMGNITQGTAESLREELRRARGGEAGGKLPDAMKLVQEDAKLKAKQLYQDDTVDGVSKGVKKADLFMYQVNKVLRENTDPEVAKVKIQAMTKDVVTAPHWYRKNETKPQWQLDYNASDVDAVARGAAKEAIGTSNFAALEGWASREGKPLTMDSVKQFLQSATPEQYPVDRKREVSIKSPDYVEPPAAKPIDPTDISELGPDKPIGITIAWLAKNNVPTTPANVRQAMPKLKEMGIIK